MQLGRTTVIKASVMRSRKGSALVEFALVSPLIIFLLLLMVQYGLIMNRFLAIAHAAREAARYAAVHPERDAPIKQRALDAMRGRRNNPNRMNVTVTPPEGAPQRVRGYPIAVTIQYDMSDELFLPSRFFGFQVFNPIVQVEATARIE